MSSSVSLRVFVWIYLSPSSVRSSWQTAPCRVVLPLHLNVQQPRMRRHMNEIQTSLQPPPMRPTHVTCAVKVAPQKRSVDLVASLRFASVRRHHLVNFPTRPFTALSVARSYMSSVSPFVRWLLRWWFHWMHFWWFCSTYVASWHGSARTCGWVSQRQSSSVNI